MTFVDSLIWIPSVFGLSPGADTFTPVILTESHRDIVKCICWLFWIVSPFTLMDELVSIVNACNDPLKVKLHYYLVILISHLAKPSAWNLEDKKRLRKWFLLLVHLCKAVTKNNRKIRNYYQVFINLQNNLDQVLQKLHWTCSFCKMPPTICFLSHQ